MLAPPLPPAFLTSPFSTMKRTGHNGAPMGALLGLTALLFAGCDALTGALEPETSLRPGAPALATVPAKGTASTLDVAAWNIEWFGSTSNGPTNETLQLQNARDVIAGTDADVWGVAEIVDQAHWNSLESQLTGYSGFLASESVVSGGSASYSASEQKVGLLYKTSIATLVSAKIILTANDYDFAGRPPLEATLRVTQGGVTEDVVFIVLHAKAFNDDPSWQRRQNASVALKNYLDTTYPTQKVFVIGDFNDDVDTSITPGKPSPYANFVSDAARYTFETKALSEAGVSSTTGYPDMIDHHLVTNEVHATYVAASAEVYRVDSYIASYSTTTSDHYPVISRYTWGGGGGATPAVTVTAPNGGESWAGGSSQTIRWTSTGVTNVKLEYSLDGGASYTVITASTGASAGSYNWTVPASATTNARVRVSDAAGTASDVSDAAFTITVSAGPAQVVINEILANEPGSNTAGEFVELVNVGGTAQDLSSWTISDASAVRHRFAAGTVLQPGKAIVVFGAASGIPSGTPGAIASSTGGLNLANGGDTVTLKDAAGATRNTFTYGASLASQDGVSMNRSPDATATGTFVLHNTISTLKASAGKRASAAAF
jgi:endonuclease/exonuclease/phosphatase family metal-dependent hydrolase